MAKRFGKAPTPAPNVRIFPGGHGARFYCGAWHRGRLWQWRRWYAWLHRATPFFMCYKPVHRWSVDRGFDPLSWHVYTFVRYDPLPPRPRNSKTWELD